VEGEITSDTQVSAMTDPGAARKLTPSGPHATPAADPRPRPRRRSAHPLIGVFPLTVMALATFMVIFTLMMARRTAVADRALQSIGASGIVEAAVQGHTLRTRTSGTALAVPSPASGTSASGARAVVTRSSGAAGATGVARED
jgi:hypothetical protein